MARSRLPRLVKRFGSDTKGASAVEYALVLALITGVVIAAIGTDDTQGLRKNIKDVFSRAGTKLDSAIT